MEYEIVGGAFPLVKCKLNKGERMKDESGAMAYMTPGIKMDTNTGGGLLKGLGRALAGDTLFMNFFTAERDGEEIGFSSYFPGKIIPIKLEGSQSIIGQKSSFLAAEDGIEIDMYFRKKLGAGLFGGEGFILQRFSGNGMVFLEIDGDVVEKTLAPGETLIVNNGHVAALDETVDFDIQRVKGVKNIVFGGEGLFFAKMTGPGRVWLQTMPVCKLAEAIVPFIPKKEE
ncbi:MAG: TIGR00266 family protein [Methanobrevibacter sp.]|jgi:uncharacterized protein (TIGR00266 family)|uniref:TIGR00266 family protein n=1 Tax=Methanobrevibacter sp. TaxID=66852 RepID=UPI0025FE24B1|nr:TIGR00266 family protein [Methanobrevibacter sp.]MBE6498859.1 TIGR00266 family protein [Methanobrevibacter sp.]